MLGPKGCEDALSLSAHTLTCHCSYQAANVTGPGGRKVIGSLQSRTAAAAAAARATPSHWPGDYALGSLSESSFKHSISPLCRRAIPGRIRCGRWLATLEHVLRKSAGTTRHCRQKELSSSGRLQSLVSAGRVAPLVASSQAQQLYGTPAAAAAAPPAKFDLAKSALFSNGRSEDAMSWSMLDRASRETARFAQGELLNTASPPRFTFAPFNSPPSTQSLALAADPRA